MGVVVTDDIPPFCTVLDCSSPVPYATKVVIDQVTPAQGCSTWRSFLSAWSASHKLSLGRRAGILQTCPNHCSLLCRNCSSIDSSPVISRMVLFRILSHKVTLRMSRRHLMWNVLSFLRSRLERFQVSAPYSKTGITSVRKART